jgi:hypothetical protein
MSQIEHATAFVQHKLSGVDDKRRIEEGVFASLVHIRDTLRPKYGSTIVACCDHKSTWRADFFQPYKASRKIRRAQSGIDWKYVRTGFRSCEDALHACTDVVVVRVQGAEGDDCISVVADRNQYEKNRTSLGGLAIGGDEPTVIVSSDKDYGQIPNVDRFDPRKNIFLPYNPQASLASIVIGGDSIDGVPNVISDDDTFVTPGKRQNTLTALRRGKLEAMYFAGDFEDKPATKEMPATHWNRNRWLVDFKFIPPSIQSDIMDEFDNARTKSRESAFGYLFEHNMTHVADSVKRLID